MWENARYEKQKILIQALNFTLVLLHFHIFRQATPCQQFPTSPRIKKPQIPHGILLAGTVPLDGYFSPVNK